MRGWIAFGVLVCCTFVVAADTAPIDNPAYASWAKCKPGTKVAMKIVGGPRETTLTQTLIEVKPDQCVVEMKSDRGDGKARAVNHPIERKVTDPDAIKRYQEQIAHFTEESVTTPAGTFKCKHYHSADESGGTSDVWVSDDVPGMDVKTVHSLPTAKATITAQVTAVEKK